MINDENLLNKKSAIEFLGISDSAFNNYQEYSKEISGIKISGRWYFNKTALIGWKKLKESRTIKLSVKEYEKCFEFALRMVYGGLSLNGIRGQRSEVQAVDDVILGILAEYAIKKFISLKFNLNILLDEEVHPSHITPQDFYKIEDNGKIRDPRIGVGVKASKLKSCFLVLGTNEVELQERKSDVYIFARVDLPSDHLFRILKDHLFFKSAKEIINNDTYSRNIEDLNEINVWICGFTYLKDLDKVTEIPGQSFDNGYRYVKSVAKMKNSDTEWSNFLKKL